MPIDWNKVKNQTMDAMKEAGKKIKQYTPETFSKEKKFVNAMVISLSLMTMADKKVEEEEITASLDILSQIDQIKELEMLDTAIELYKMHIETLEKAAGKTLDWTVTVSKMMSEIGKVKDYPEYPPMIENLLDYIANSDGDFVQEEKEMKQKIVEALK